MNGKLAEFPIILLVFTDLVSTTNAYIGAKGEGGREPE